MLLDPRPHWAPLCRLVGLEPLIADARFATTPARMQHAELLVAALQAQIGAHSWREHWAVRFEAWDAPWELIRRVDELASDPQVLANEMVFPLPVGSQTVRVVAGPTVFDGRSAPLEPQGSPALGQHTAELLRAAGYSAEQLATLRVENIVR